MEEVYGWNGIMKIPQFQLHFSVTNLMYCLLHWCGVGFVFQMSENSLKRILKMYYKSVQKGQRKEFTELVFPSKDI